MISSDFLAFVGAPERLQALLSRLVPAGDPPPRLNRLFDAPELVVFAPPEATAIRLPRRSGIVIGRMFNAHGTPLGELEDDSGGGSLATQVDRLLSGTWGSYAAFLRGNGGAAILRDPSGSVPVHRCTADGVEVYFSNFSLVRDLGVIGEDIDEEFLRQWLSFPYLRTARTGLKHVEELVPGTVRTWKAGHSEVRPAWSPWDWASPRRQILDFEDAATRLCETALRTVPAQLAGNTNLLLEMSGGLDSSIVACCLASAGLRYRAANFVTRAPDGDERSYARLLAAALGTPLAELVEDDLALELLPPEPGLRPPLSPVLQPLDRALSGHARGTGSTGFVTGAGGDNLFCYLTTTAPLLDAWRAMGTGGALNVLRDVAALGDSTLWTTIRYAARKRFRPRPFWERDERFLSAEAIAAAPDQHPWLQRPADAMAGKIEHVESLVRARHFLEPRYPTGEATLHPLLNQPLIELCLSIPTWLWVRGGRNRAVARAAFAGLLPPAILQRRTKGRLESMCARAYSNNREPLRALLLEGEVSRRGLIDRPAVEAYLGSERPQGDDYFRLFDLASLELWLRSWRAASPARARSASARHRRY